MRYSGGSEGLRWRPKLRNEHSKDKAVILRMGKARATISRAGDYIRHATTVLFPKIRAIEGHRGEYLLRPEVEEGVELVVLTLWESMKPFAGSRGQSRKER